jgi:hypothetical protein
MDNNIITVKLKGGLGNFLFQIATSFNYSKKYNKKLVINANDVYVVHNNINHYQDNIFSKLEFVNYTPFLEKKYTETLFEYNEIPHFEGSLYIDGYFQSEKYFSSLRNEILKLFDFGEKTKNKITKKYSEYLDKNTCSIHVRRGDYLNYPDTHPTLTLEYYSQAISHFEGDVTFLVFSDDINWCKENLNLLTDRLVYIEGNTDYQDLYLMSICKNNIICNSTFSWWGAWLNKNKNKKVITPSKWFGDKLKHYNTNDLYCNNWIKI